MHTLLASLVDNSIRSFNLYSSYDTFEILVESYYFFIFFHYICSDLFLYSVRLFCSVCSSRNFHIFFHFSFHYHFASFFSYNEILYYFSLSGSLSLSLSFWNSIFSYRIFYSLKFVVIFFFFSYLAIFFLLTFLPSFSFVVVFFRLVSILFIHHH